jgi:hypothetical protein
MHRTVLIVLSLVPVSLAQSPRFGRASYASLTTPAEEVEYKLRTLGDFDGDGDQDISCPKRFGFNDGQGRFALGPAATVFGFEAGTRAVGDVDGDGDDEVLCLSSFAGITLWRADAAGKPVPIPATLPQAIMATNASPLSELDDLDGDGDLDFVVVFVPGSLSTHPPAVVLNQGGLVFTVGAPFPSGGQFNALAIGDFDGDGDRDLFGWDAQLPASPNRRIAWNNGGVYTLTAPFGGSGALTAAAAADFTGDGLIDVAIGRRMLPGDPGYDALLANDGGGIFTTSVTAFPAGPTSLRAFDLDVDGAPELLRGVSDELIDAHVVTAAGIDPVLVKRMADPGSVGDVDGDGDADAVSYEHLGALRLRLATPTGLIDADDGPFGFAQENFATNYGDFDGDGDIDVAGVVQTPESATVSFSVRLQTTPGRFEAEGDSVLTPIGAPPIDASASADLDGDGVFEILVAGAPGSRLRVYSRDGSGTLQATDAGPAPTASRRVIAFDADGDGDRDILVVAHPQNTVSLPTEKSRFYLNQGGFTFTSVEVGTPQYGSDAAAVDLDGDGDLDVLHANASSGVMLSATALMNQGGGIFVEATFAPATVGRTATAADLDLDGDIDVVIGPTPLYRTSGATFVAGPPAPFVNGFVGNATLADVTGDGYPDLLASGGLCPGLGAPGFGAYDEMRPWNAFTTFQPNNQLEAFDIDHDGDLDVGDRRGHLFRNRTRQLDVDLVPALGRTAALEIHGTPGEIYSLYFATQLAAPVALPPLGVLHLALLGAQHVGGVALDAAGRGGFSVAVPNNPVFDGVDLYWQGFHFSQLKLGKMQATTVRNY